LIAVFDVDSSEVNAFDEKDRDFLEKIMPETRTTIIMLNINFIILVVYKRSAF